MTELRDIDIDENLDKNGLRILLQQIHQTECKQTNLEGNDTDTLGTPDVESMNLYTQVIFISHFLHPRVELLTFVDIISTRITSETVKKLPILWCDTVFTV